MVVSSLLAYHAVLYNTNGRYTMKKTEKLRIKFKEKDTMFSGSVAVGILWGFPQVFPRA